MVSLLFHPAELRKEIEALKRLSSAFLDPTSYQLEELASDIDGLVTRAGGTVTLEIPQDRPLRTRVSVGEFEPLCKGSGRRVNAEVSGIWEIEYAKYKLNDPERPAKKNRDRPLIGFVGLASTVISIYDVGANEPIAYWKMELGDGAAPGCFFHTFAPVDHDFPVPRHPNFSPTPMSAIEFALGELFQDAWEKAVSSATGAPNIWRSIQKERLTKLLEWQMGLIADTTASPWFELKAAKPAAELFV